MIIEFYPPPGAYNIDHHTIEKVTKIENEDDPDLTVKKPPFNTGMPRFKDNLIKSKYWILIL